MSAAQGRERRPIAAERSRGAFNWRFYRQSFALHCKVTALCEYPSMADESTGPIEGSAQPLQVAASDGDGRSVAGDGSHLIAALIAQKLRDSGVGCEIVHPVATDAAVLRRDRAVIVLTVALHNILGGLIFVAAGLYQWTRLNDLCLAECQRPFEFVMRHGGSRRDALGCVVL